MANTYLTRTPSSAGNRKTWTFSAWIKRSALGSSINYLFSAGTDGTGADRRYGFYLYNDLLYQDRYGGSNALTQVFRDVSAWYHIVIAMDTTQATASNRTKVYINNTLYNLTTLFNQNEDTPVNSTLLHAIGGGTDNLAADHFNGSMSHINFIDGTAYDATAFGEYDANGVWKINTSPSVTYGTNGFFILKNGNSVTDQSGNTNNFTVGGGTLTNTEDSPSSVFATMNPLNSVYISFLNGNNTLSGGNNGTDFSYIGSTIGASSGKYYWEAKVTDLAEIDQVGIALASANFASIGTSHGLQGTQYGGKGFQFSNGNKVGDGSQSAYMGGFSANNIMMIALDLDNNKITFGRDGQWGNGSGGADQTYSNSTPAYTNLTAGEFYVAAHAMRGSGGNTGITQYNFGNGYFGTTAVSSAGTNASGNGIFEYDVPTGFTALSTKGLNL